MVLNHYAINQTVRGEMVPTGRAPCFGRLALPAVVGEMLKHRPRPRARVVFDLTTDKMVFDAFLTVADEASPESLLLDPALAKRFHAAARKLGFHASAADMNRRLLNIRKNPARYKGYGLILPRSERAEPQPSIVPQYAHIIEFSLSRLHSRYGVSIDDILIDPALGDEYEKMVKEAAPDLTPVQLRLAALYIRKTRYIKKNNVELIESLDSATIEAAFAPVQRMVELKPEAGLIELLEDNRHLYISRNENLKSAVEQITSESSLHFMANEFWRPRRENLVVRVLAGEKFLEVPVSQWQLKLITDKKPVFNWPMAA